MITLEERYAASLWALVIFAALVIYSILPNSNNRGILKVFFRGVTAFAVVYLIAIVFFIILDQETLRHLLIKIDSKLIKKVVERDYS